MSIHHVKFPYTNRAANTFIKKGPPITFFPSSGFLRNAHMLNLQKKDVRSIPADSPLADD